MRELESQFGYKPDIDVMVELLKLVPEESQMRHALDFPTGVDMKKKRKVSSQQLNKEVTSKADKFSCIDDGD